MTDGVLLMTFGAVERLEDVPAYYRNIRGGTEPTAAQVQDLRTRYERIGGRSPLRGILEEQARALERRLREMGHAMPVEPGMKHWSPTVAEGVRALRERGVRRILGLTSGPYDSRFSLPTYERALVAAARSVDADLDVRMVRRWHDAPGLDDAWAAQVHAALDAQGWTKETTHVLFSAHALPERVLVWNDPYPRDFAHHAERLADRLGLGHWGLCYQSAGLTSERWLGPDVLDGLAALRDMDVARVLVAPIGFSADHLEILHDLDWEAKARALQLGIAFARAPSLNDHPGLIGAWAAAVLAHRAPSHVVAPAPRLDARPLK